MSVSVNYVVNPEKLKAIEYGMEAVETLMFGYPITRWNDLSDTSKQAHKDYPEYETFVVKEYPNGDCFLYGVPDRTKVDAVLLQELPRAER